MRTFKAKVRKQGPNPYVDVPRRISSEFARFAQSGRIRIEGKLNGASIRGTLIPVRNGQHRLFLHSGMRSAARVGVGDQVRITLRPIEPNEVSVPADVASALARERRSREAFDKLSPSHRRELLRFVDVPAPQQRERRIGEMIGHLLGRAPSSARVAPERPLWVCPRCGNEFVTRNQYHSCKRLTLEDSFAGKSEEIRDLFDRFRKMVEMAGPVKIVPYRDKVGFMVRVRFAGVVPRSRWIDVVFWLRRRLKHPRFLKVETLLPNAHIHVVRITEPSQLDRQLAAWIREAYEIGSQRA